EGRAVPARRRRRVRDGKRLLGRRRRSRRQSGPPARGARMTGSSSQPAIAVDVRAFVRANLPPPPARVLEIGAGGGELARALAGAGYEVVAIDPEPRGPNVQRVPLDRLEADAGSFDAAVAIVSLHHVEPLAESCARLAELLRPGGTLVVDEFDVGAFDRQAATWWLEQRRALGEDPGG